MAQLLALAQAKREWPEEFLQLLAGLWYDFSQVRDGVSLSEKYQLGMQGAELLIDAIIKLYRWKEEDDESGGG